MIWPNLQKAYELRLTEQAIGEEIKRTISTRLSTNVNLGAHP